MWKPFAAASPGSRSERRLWLASLALHLLAAALSAGYYNPDEHFQILELIRYKLGANLGQELTWEFPERIRPWLQPWFYLQLVKLQVALGVQNPFVHAAVLRLASASIGWASLVLFARACLPWLPGPGARRWLVPGLTLVWFFPFLHARTSSENLSGSLFLIGLSLVALVLERRAEPGHATPAAVGRWREDLLLATGGLLFGAAFHCRYQVGLMIAGVGVWLLWSRRWRGCLVVGAGLLGGLALGALADRWGYGAWTLPAWRYFDVNLRQGVASQFSVEPWWYYLRKIVSRSPAGLGLLFVLLVPIAWARRPLHLLTLASAPFFVVHCLLAHKELRFIFPLGAIGVVLALLGAAEVARAAARFGLAERCVTLWRRGRRTWRVLLAGLVAANGLYLLVGCLFPLRPEVVVFRALFRETADSLRLATVAGPDGNPYVYGAGVSYRFYAPAGLTVTQASGADELAAEVRRDPRPLVVYLPVAETPPPLSSACTERYRWPPAAIPLWVLRKIMPTGPEATILRCPGGAPAAR